MAKSKVGLSGGVFVQSAPKKTRQGQGKHTLYSATSRNKAKKPYRGQGKESWMQQLKPGTPWGGLRVFCLLDGLLVCIGRS